VPAAPIGVVVAGAAGRMGQAVCAAVEQADDMALVARADPELGVELGDALDGADANAVVDFTIPTSVFDNVKVALEEGVHAVVGTTGLTEDQLDEIRELAERSVANCFVAPNFAIGAVLMMEAAKLAAPHMPDCEIVELHHEGKLDAPSGTAKRTAELISDAGGRRDVPIHSVRLPGLVAHQEVIFGGLGQTLTIRHDSLSRESFMPGVLLAVRKVGELDGLVVGLESLL
jgi:4-hydroxy-tetrahydrodipicolinate reductase